MVPGPTGRDVDGPAKTAAAPVLSRQARKVQVIFYLLQIF